MDITIKINTDNAAFEGCLRGEVASILRQLADNVSQGPRLDNDTSIALRDVNGNTVGRLTVQE